MKFLFAFISIVLFSGLSQAKTVCLMKTGSGTESKPYNVVFRSEFQGSKDFHVLLSKDQSSARVLSPTDMKDVELWKTFDGRLLVWFRISKLNESGISILKVDMSAEKPFSYIGFAKGRLNGRNGLVVLDISAIPLQIACDEYE